VVTGGAQINKKQAGGGLSEVMVGLVLLGVGMLGIMNKQTQAWNLNQQAYLQSQATSLVRDIADRMKANPDAAASYLIDYGASASSGTDCTSTDCSQAELAGWDLSQWLGAVAATLPQGDGEIVSQADGYLISIEFDADRAEANELTEVSVFVRL